MFCLPVRGEILEVRFRHVITCFQRLVGALHSSGEFALFKMSEREVVPRRAEGRLLAQYSVALFDTAVIVALHEQGGSQSRAGLHEFGFPAQGFFQRLDGFVRFAALKNPA